MRLQLLKRSVLHRKDARASNLTNLPPLLSLKPHVGKSINLFPQGDEPSAAALRYLEMFLAGKKTFKRLSGSEFAREYDVQSATRETIQNKQGAISWTYTFVIDVKAAVMYVRESQDGTQIVNHYQGALAPSEDETQREPTITSATEEATSPPEGSPASEPVTFNGKPIAPGTTLTVSYLLNFRRSSDSYDDASAASTLASLAALLKANPQFSVWIAGNIYSPDTSRLSGNSPAALAQPGYYLNGAPVTAATLMLARARRVRSTLTTELGVTNRLRVLPGNILNTTAGLRVVITIVRPVP
jgi:hypothetical protein